MEEKEKIIKDLKDIPEVDDITITAGGKSVKTNSRKLREVADALKNPAKRPRGRPSRPRQNEMPLTGVGVEITTDKRLIELGEAFKDARESLKKLDAEIQQRMAVIGVKCFRVDCDFWRIDEKRHVKVTKLKDPEIAALDKADDKGA